MVLMAFFITKKLKAKYPKNQLKTYIIGSYS